MTSAVALAHVETPAAFLVRVRRGARRWRSRRRDCRRLVQTFRQCDALTERVSVGFWRRPAVILLASTAETCWRAESRVGLPARARATACCSVMRSHSGRRWGGCGRLCLSAGRTPKRTGLAPSARRAFGVMPTFSLKCRWSGPDGSLTRFLTETRRRAGPWEEGARRWHGRNQPELIREGGGTSRERRVARKAMPKTRSAARATTSNGVAGLCSRWDNGMSPRRTG